MGIVNDGGGTVRKLVAIRASALLRESLKSALSAKGFDVDDKREFDEAGLSTPAELLICEVTEDTEALASRLLRELPAVALVFIGPVTGEAANTELQRRRNVRELSADVSVSEVVRVCQQVLFGTAPGSIPKPAASQTSTPFSVLPRPSDPPPSRPGQSVSSNPAPLLTGSGPPSSRPSSASLSPPSIPPAALASFTRPSLSAGGQELSHELALLLEDADRRVAQRMRPRLSLPPPPEPPSNEAPLRMSPEIHAALEDPIGDYDIVGRSEPPQTTRPRTQQTLSKDETVFASGPPSSGLRPDATEAKTGTGMAPPESRSFTSGEDESNTGGGSDPAPRGAYGVVAPAADKLSQQAAYTVVPGSDADSPRAPERTLDSQPASEDEPGSVEDSPGSEPATARPPPPERTRQYGQTPRPRQGPTPLPPDPLLPKGEWLQSALGQQEDALGPPDQRPTPAPGTVRVFGDSPVAPRPSNPTKPDSQKPDTRRPMHTPRVGESVNAGSSASAAPPTDAPRPEQPGSGELSQQDLPPLQEGDGARVLAHAIRTRFTGAVAYEADGGIRRAVLKDGDLVTASSSVKAESLLSFLVVQRRLDPEVSAQLEHKLPNFGRHAGAALIAGGHIAQDQLWPVLRAHAEFVVGRALGLAQGLAAYEQTVPERLQAEPSVFGGATGSEVLIEILRRTVPPAVAVRRLGGPRVQLELGPNTNLLDECALAPEELVALEWASRLCLEDLLVQAEAPEFACVLLGLVELQVLKAVGRTASRPNSSTPKVYDRLDDDALRRAIEMRMALVQNGDYFSILGLPRGATGYDVKRAYADLRRQFDPSSVLTPGTADLSDDVELILEVAEEAYSILRDQLKRERYQRAIESVPSNAARY